MATSAPYAVMDIIFDAMSQVGAIQADEPPQPFEQNLCLRRLNTMLDRWSAQKLMLRSYASFNFQLTAGKFSYLIGPAVGVADIVLAKPMRILGGAFIRDSSNSDYPLTQVEKAEWDSYTDKALTSNRPEVFCYDPGAAQQGGTGMQNPTTSPGVSLGTIYFYQTPDSNSGYTFNYEADCYLTEFTGINQTVNFELCYYEALYMNLARRIYRDFNEHAKEIPSDIIEGAAGSLRTIKDLNSRQVVAKVESPVSSRGGVFNVYTNEYVGGGN